MANSLYTNGKIGMMTGLIDLDTAVIKCAIVRGYTPALTTHVFVSDVTTAGGTLVVTSGALTSITTTSGIFDAADVTFTAVGAGASCAHILVFQASAVTGGADVATSAQRVICLMDTSTGVTLPITPNGGDIVITWDNGTNKIFAL